MIIAIGIALTLTVMTFVFHYRVMLQLGSSLSKAKGATQLRVLVIMVVLFFAHLIEIALYAGAYMLSVELLHLGVFGGLPIEGPMAYLYYSGVIYTSLGLGEIYPSGHIRILTAMETLNGLMLITWSASYTFLAMGELWRWDSSSEKLSGE